LRTFKLLECAISALCVGAVDARQGVFYPDDVKINTISFLETHCRVKHGSGFFYFLIKQY